ncbi:MAG: sigma-70 family RNA polymerase sigma factor [Bacteroidales bacterium]|nr:sigma-70 family RNA polymerase sigma factor [Bacteroidales bacterium]
MCREEELKIIEKIKAGDSLLYDRLVLEHSPKIISVIRGVVGNNEDSEEIAQDVFVKAFFSLDKFRGDSSFATWLFRIAYNMAISKMRKKRYSFVDIENAKLPVFMNDQNDENEAEERERKFIMLEKILKNLETHERFLIMLFYNQDKSIKEISQITGMGEPNVKVTLHRIKKKLAVIADSKMEVSYG